MHIGKEIEGKWGMGTGEGEREGGVGLCSTDGSTNGDMSPLICPSRDSECDSVWARIWNWKNLEIEQ